MNKKITVEHFKNGLGAVTKSPLEITRIRSILATIVLPLVPGVLLLTDTPLILSGDLSLIYHEYLPDILHAAIAIAAILGPTFWYLRKRAIRSLSVKKALHGIAHDLRDELSSIRDLREPSAFKRLSTHTANLLPSLGKH